MRSVLSAAAARSRRSRSARDSAPLASDKAFYFLFQNNPDLILRWLEDLPADAGGHTRALISEQAFAMLQGQQASRRVWAAIADWREAVDPANPSPLEWPLPSGEDTGEGSVKAKV